MKSEFIVLAAEFTENSQSISLWRKKGEYLQVILQSKKEWEVSHGPTFPVVL